MLDKLNHLNIVLLGNDTGLGFGDMLHALELMLKKHDPDIFAIIEAKLVPGIADKEICSK